MIIHDVEQGSEAWYQVRSGICSASNFEIARTILKSGPRKGQPGDEARKYAFRLAVEQISGQPLRDAKFESYAMRRGSELESEARRVYELRTGEMVKESGFATTDDKVFGASVDGLLDGDGGLEIKCFVEADKLRKILLDDDPSDVMAQMQGGMFVTERDHWDLALYCPFLEPAKLDMKIIRVWRDQEYITEMVKELRVFNEMVLDYKLRLRDSVVA